MQNDFLVVHQSLGLQGETHLYGAKNAVLVIMASLILTDGISTLKNVPASDDVLNMIQLLQDLGAKVSFNAQEHTLIVDTATITVWKVSPALMKKMRASVLVMGPLLARFARVELAMPGGCVIGARPIDLHIKNFEKMGVTIDMKNDVLQAHAAAAHAQRIILDYPSVGATENILMLAVLTPGTTSIINAALEPEVYDLIDVLRAMGAQISLEQQGTITISGVASLRPIEHSIIPDRLEAGTLLLAAAITGGEIRLAQARADHLDVFLLKLEEMGHAIVRGENQTGIYLKAISHPRAVSFKTMPYPGFPTDLQAPMMAAQIVAQGTSIVEETVFENRLLHVVELQKMGAHIKVEGNKAHIIGVEQLYGTSVIASDIRASCSLMLAGLVAQGTTTISGVHHWKRGYEGLEKKLATLGARISYCSTSDSKNAAIQLNQAQCIEI